MFPITLMLATSTAKESLIVRQLGMWFKIISSAPPAPHPSVPPASHVNFRDPTNDRWAQGPSAALAQEDLDYERGLIADCNAHGGCPHLPARDSGVFKRKKKDDCWRLGRGALREFYPFSDPRGEPGKFHEETTGGSRCSLPGFEKGTSGEPGPRGATGSDPPGPPGPPGPVVPGVVTTRWLSRDWVPPP